MLLDFRSEVWDFFPQTLIRISAKLIESGRINTEYRWDCGFTTN